MANPDDVQRATDGAAVWNEWANECLRAGQPAPVDFSRLQPTPTGFDGFVFPGPAIFTGASFISRANFKRAVFHGTVDFSEAAFHSGADFSEAQFHDNAIFSRSGLHGGVLFNGSIFHADVAIDRAFFGGDAGFDGAQFKRSVEASHLMFQHFVTFKGARFQGKVRFVGASFLGETDFSDTSFNYVDFTGAKFEHALARFTRASFNAVPDFRSSAFKGTLNLGMVRVGPERSLWARLTTVAPEDEAAKFRRLKQLAAEIKDHERELQFFSGELRAKRFRETKGSPAAPPTIVACRRT